MSERWAGARAEAPDVARACWLGDTAALSSVPAAALNQPQPNGTLPIGFACGYGRPAALQILLARRCSPDAPCAGAERPIHRAARFGHLECVRLLLDAGASPELPDAKGWTALQHAAGRGHARVAAALARLGPRELISGALLVAAQHGRADCVLVLVRAGAELSWVDGAGQTALMVAASWGHQGVVQSLLAAAADPTVRDASGHTAADAAAARGYERCVQTLEASPAYSRQAIRGCVVRARQLSDELVVITVKLADMDSTTLAVLVDTTQQQLDICQLMSRLAIPKQDRAAMGVYLDLAVWRHDGQIGPARVLELIRLSYEQHSSWVARVSCHGSDPTRHRAFAEFVASSLGIELAGRTVLEAAGGRGALARQLVELGASRVILVDPAAHAGALVRDLEESGRVTVLNEPLDATFESRHPELAAQAELIVGLHPDQATDITVMFGLERRIPLAVVPCCVFPKLFQRKRRSGQGVVSCNGLVEYFLELDPERLQAEILRFEGANRVVFAKQIT